jgi:hypothetical protein
MFSKIVRRTHMYLALFLTPWVLAYAASTMVMNHRDLFRRIYGGAAPAWVKESERSYRPELPAGAPPQAVGREILRELGLEGAFNARRDAAGVVTIVRQEPVVQKRVVYRPAEGSVIVEREEFRMPAFLERIHRRRGYQHPFVLEDSWAFSVDAFIVAMIFWFASGLWMWWEMGATRRTGALFAAGGLALFALFLFTI